MGLEVVPVPCLQDNYAFLLVCSETGHCAVVDPSQTEPVHTALQARGLTLKAILNTHHHWDHVGGNLELAQLYPGIPIYGHASDRGRIDGQTHFLQQDDAVAVGQQAARVLHIPGHTLGAIAYVFSDAVFTGDTLFGGGCGRLFEGTPAMMYASLNVKLAALDPQTRVYFGHEYTVSNLRFALSLEPGNQALQARKARADALRSKGLPTVPSTLAEEALTNPFMRCAAPELLQNLAARSLETHAQRDWSTADPAVVLGRIREIKDSFH